METEDRRAILLTGGIITVAILLGCAKRKREYEPLPGGNGYPGPQGGPVPASNGGYVPGPTGGSYGAPSPGGSPSGPPAPSGGPAGGEARPMPAPGNAGQGLTMSPSQYASAAGQSRPMALFNGSAAGQQTQRTQSVASSEMPRAHVMWTLAEEDEEDEDDGLMTPYVARGLSQ